MSVADPTLAPAPSASAPSVPGRRAPGTMLRLAVAGLAVVPIAVYLYIALHRVGYPYELDWMEGGSVGLTARVAAGHSLYVAPSLSFVGWTYTPLYYWLTGALATVTGVGFALLRAVSLLASLVAMATLAWMVARETGDRVAGLIAGGLYAAAFQLSGAWFDTGRVDSLLVAITLLAVAAARWAETRRAGVGVGVLVFLAFFTKQSALVALAPVVAWLVAARPRAGLPAAGTAVALIVGSTVVLQLTTGGWYGFYVFGELAGQPWANGEFVQFWTRDLLRHEWPLVVLLVAAAPAVLRARRELAGRVMFWSLAGAGLLASAWISRLHTGGYANVLMPAYAGTALLAGLAAGAWLRGPGWRPAALAVLLAAQLALLAYPIGAQIPTAADETAGGQLLNALRRLPGPIVVLRHPWYATEVGQGSFAQGEAITDVLRSSDPRGARALRASLRNALRSDHVRAVVLDGPFDTHVFSSELGREFRLVPRAITPTRLYPLTDVRTAPTLLYLRRASG